MYKIKIFYVLTIFILLTSLSYSNSQLTSTSQTHKSQFEIPLSKEGQYLYTILINKKTGDFVKELILNESYDKSQFEVIKVYSKGAYPEYEPNEIHKYKESIFRDDTFDDIITDGQILLSTDFDKEKFLKVANEAIKKMQDIEEEKYQKVKFDIDFKIDTSINEEYATATILIHHKPSLELKKAIFYVNGSAMYADKLSSTNISPVLRKEIYKVGLPSGKNIVQVNFSSVDGQAVDKMAMVKNLFKGKTTFHIVAIGINEFPNWTLDKTLKNAINDANYIKNIFEERSPELFIHGLKIKPYTLDYQNTTKENIDKLLEEVRKNIKPNDYFLFYIASHGITKDEGKEKKYYFALSDFSFDTKYWYVKNGFKDNQISEYLMNIPSIFRIAILDTCHAGQEIENIKADLNQLPFAKKDGISILAATKNTQVANDNYKGHGLFTYILGEGLNGKADFNKDGVVDSIEIAEYVQKNVGQISRTETSIIQDARVLPNPKENYNRRFELTLLKNEKPRELKPNIFTPQESQLYIDAIHENDIGMMNGIIQNNIRHNSTENTESIDINQLTQEELTRKLTLSNSININVHFDVNIDVLNNQELAKFEMISEVLRNQISKGKRIFIEGHTDWDGDMMLNMNLSQRRANNIAKLLSTKFKLDNNRLSALGFGSIYPLADNNTIQGRAKNRRVSIFFYE